MDFKKILLNIWIATIIIIIVIEIILNIQYNNYNFKNYINLTKCLIKELIHLYNISTKDE